MHKEIYTEKLLGATCGESHLYMLQFLEMFMNAYKGVPKISLVWLTRLAHDALNTLYHADDQFLKFFKKNRKNFEHSFLFFFADHGPRYSGAIARFAELTNAQNQIPFTGSCRGDVWFYESYEL
uniref:Sulfatase N-terminal domain-containing protein n=1 Tax=Haemonchus contortus TaxID=6289 RepID=W6NG21_HAECO